MRYRITGKASEPAAGFQITIQGHPKDQVLMRQTACTRRFQMI